MEGGTDSFLPALTACLNNRRYDTAWFTMLRVGTQQISALLQQPKKKGMSSDSVYIIKKYNM